MVISSDLLLNFSIWLLTFIALFNDSQYGVSFSWVLVPAVIAFLAVVIKNGRVQLKREHLTAICFWFVCFISTLISPVVDAQRDLISFLLFVALYIVMTSSVRNWDHSRKIILVYILVATVGSLVIINNFVHGIYYNEWFQRSTVTFMGVSRDPNYVAGFLAPLPILVLTYEPLKKRKSTGVVKAALIILGLTALVLDGSRGGIISAVIPVALYFLLKVKSNAKKIAIILAILVTFIIGYRLILEYLPVQTIERLLFRQSADTRSSLWKAGLNGFYSNPILGQGIGAASYYSRQLVGNYSHNMYIDILSGSGLLGIVIYLVLIVQNIICNCRVRDCLKTNIVLIAIALFFPQFFINGFNTLSMWLPLIIAHHVNVYCMDILFEE